eukprot:10121539-Alexandrium_andersonii.AAC.1
MRGRACRATGWAILLWVISWLSGDGEGLAHGAVAHRDEGQGIVVAGGPRADRPRYARRPGADRHVACGRSRCP